MSYITTILYIAPFEDYVEGHVRDYDIQNIFEEAPLICEDPKITTQDSRSICCCQKIQRPDFSFTCTASWEHWYKFAPVCLSMPFAAPIH